jgi:hypothetical protein
MHREAKIGAAFDIASTTVVDQQAVKQSRVLAVDDAWQEVRYGWVDTPH